MQQNGAKNQGDLDQEIVGCDVQSDPTHGEADDGIGQGVESEVVGHVDVLDKTYGKTQKGGFKGARPERDVDQHQNDQVRLQIDDFKGVNPGGLQDKSQDEQKYIAYDIHQAIASSGV